MDSVGRDGVAKPNLAIGRFHVVVFYDIGMAAFRRGAGYPCVNDKRVVPTLVDFFVLVINDIGIHVVVAGFPRFILGKERVLGVLSHFTEREFCVFNVGDES